MTSLEEIESRYPHVAQSLRLAWGTPLFAHTIKHYFLDTRDHTRRGFPHDIAGLLVDALIAHDEKFPHLKVNVSFTGVDLEVDRQHG